MQLPATLSFASNPWDTSALQAQVVPDSVIPSHPILSNCKPPKAASVALSFFGDYTVSYLSDDRVLSWKEGVAHAFHTSAPERRNKNLLKSIREAAAFLAVGGVRRVAPPTWWCSPPAYDPNLPHLSPKKSAPKPAPAPKTKAQKDDKVVKGVKQPVQTKHSARAVHKVPAAPTPRAAVPLSPRADAGGSKEKIRWSARDVLKPLVNRLKQLYPALAAEETPSATEDLHNYITARFGTYLDIDNNLKGKTPFDLLAEMFTKLTGRQFTGDQLAGCFSAPDVAHYKLNPVALRALGIDLTAYKLPLKGNVPARAQTSAPKAVAAAAAAAAAVAPRRPAVTLTDASAPSLRVVNGRIMFQAGKRGRPSGAADSDDSGALNSAAVAAVAPGIDPRYAQPPSYVHIKQNVWVSRPKPK